LFLFLGSETEEIKSNGKASEAGNVEFEIEATDNNNLCTICNEEDPPGNRKVVYWESCDSCSCWAHLKCAKASAEWCNVTRESWLCAVHNT